MQKFRGVVRRAAVALGGAALALAAAYAAAQLPPGNWPLMGAVFLHRPALALQLLGGAPSAQAAAVYGRQTGESAQPAATLPPRPAASPAPQATPEPTQPPEDGQTPAPQTTAPPDLAATGPIRAQTFAQGSGNGFVALGAGTVQNTTGLADAELGAAISAEGGALPFAVEVGSAEPQVLILHTHATETYQLWDEAVYDQAFSARSRDKTVNMCAVGARMAEILNAAGINTLHDETLHDSPSYTESYARSAETTQAYLEQYPSIKVVLDVHRDAIENDGARIKPLCSIEGEDTAQVMIIAGCSNGSTVNLPHWRQNLRFAAAWETQMETMYPGLTRPVLCGYRFYNQDLTTGSLLIEIGGHANTLAEALRGGEYAARALAALLGGTP